MKKTPINNQVQLITTVWSSELDTLLMMRYEVKFTSYRIKSVSNSLDQTVAKKWTSHDLTIENPNDSLYSFSIMSVDL